MVPEVARAANAAGWDVTIVALVQRADLGEWKQVSARLSNPLGLAVALRKIGPSHICMTGSVDISDREREGLFSFVKKTPKRSHSTGDTGLSRLIRALEMISGARVIGVHEIVTDLVAPAGLIAGPKLKRGQIDKCRHALYVAGKIGGLDIAQAVVCSGYRVIGVEDIAGTDALIKRVRGFVEQKLTGNGRDALVLAKAKKPRQPLVADLPAIGPDTVKNAHDAGIAIIAVDAGNSLLIDKARLIALADELGVSVLGARADDDKT